MGLLLGFNLKSLSETSEASAAAAELQRHPQASLEELKNEHEKLEKRAKELSQAKTEIEASLELERAARQAEEARLADAKKRLADCMEQLATAREQAATREATLSKELQAEKTQSEKLNVAFRKEHCILQQRWASEESRRRDLEQEQENMQQRVADEKSKLAKEHSQLQQKLAAEETRRKEVEKAAERAMEKFRKAQQEQGTLQQKLLGLEAQRKEAANEAAGLRSQVEELRRQQLQDTKDGAGHSDLQPSAAGQPTVEGKERDRLSWIHAVELKRRSADGGRRSFGQDEQTDWTFDASDLEEGARVLAMPNRPSVSRVSAEILHAGRERTDPLPRRSEELPSRLDVLARQQTAINPLPSSRSDRLEALQPQLVRVPRVIPPRDTMVYAGVAEHTHPTRKPSLTDVDAQAESVQEDVDEFAADVSAPASRENTGNSDSRGPLVGAIPASSSTSMNSLARRNRRSTAGTLPPPGLGDVHLQRPTVLPADGPAAVPNGCSGLDDCQDDAGGAGLQSSPPGSVRLWNSASLKSAAATPQRRASDVLDERNYKVTLSQQDRLADIPIREYSAPIAAQLSRSPRQVSSRECPRELSAPLPQLGAPAVARSPQSSFMRPCSSAGNAVMVVGVGEGQPRPHLIHTSHSGGRLSNVSVYAKQG